MSNFVFAIHAIIKDMRVFLQSFIYNKGLVGFVFGIFIAATVTAFILTKDPRALPIMLRYSQMDSFMKVVEKKKKRKKEGTITLPFSKFIKVYTQVRMLFFVAIISFFVMITTVVLTSSVQVQ